MPSSGSQDVITQPSDDGFRRHEYFVNYPNNPPANLISRSNQLRDNVRATFAWAHTIATDQVRRRLADGQLGRNDGHAELGYRAKVVNHVLRNNASSWLTPTLTSNVDTAMDIKKDDFKDQLYDLLRGMQPSPPVTSGAKEFLAAATKATKDGSLGDGTTVHFWHSLAFFKYDPVTRTIDAGLQTFHISLKVERYTITPKKPKESSLEMSAASTDSSGTSASPHKAMVPLWPSKEEPVHMIKIEPIFTAVQYDFNDDMFEKSKSDIMNKIAELRHVTPVSEVDP